MAEDKNKQTPQPIRESVVPQPNRSGTVDYSESVRKSDVTNTMPAPANPFRNGDHKKDD